MDTMSSVPETAKASHRRNKLIVGLLLLLLGAGLVSWLSRPRPILAVTIREAEGSDRGTLILVDPIRGTEISRKDVTGSPAGVAFAPTGDEVLVAGQASSLVTVHAVPDLATQGEFTVDWRPVNLRFLPTQDGALHVDYGPRGQKIYARPDVSRARSTSSPTHVDGGLSIPRGTLKLRNVKGGFPGGPNHVGRPLLVFIDMELTEALVVDSPTGNVIGSVPVGPKAIALGWGPDGKKCYVVVNGEDAVKVLDPKAMVVTKTIPVGSSPNFFLRIHGTNLAAVLNQRSGTMSILDLKRDEVRHTVQVGGVPQRVDAWPAGPSEALGPRPAKVAQAAQNR